MMKASVLAVVFMLAACGGGGGRDVPDTLGEFCLDLSDAACERLAECNDQVDQASCETQLYAACCADDGTCNSALDPAGAPTEDEYNRCMDDISSAACQQIENGDFPQSCDDL